MPQGRIILKRISESKRLPQLRSDGARLLYTWLIPHVDVNGCYSADPEVIKGKVFTKLHKSTKTVASYLEDLGNIGLIVLYNTNGENYLYIPDFVEKQPSLKPDREAKTTIPLPTQEQLKTKTGVNPPKVKESKVKESKYTQEFEIFWKQAWKGRWDAETDTHRKGSKMKAFEVWQTLSIDEQRAAYTAAAKMQSWSFVPDCVRWLKEKRWEK